MNQLRLIQSTAPQLDQLSDENLIRLFQAGDESVFRILVYRYQERIRNLLFSMFNDADVVDDLAQEIFIKTYHALSGFEFRSSFYTWLYRIAVNHSRDEMRRRKVRRFFSLQGMMESGSRELYTRLRVLPCTGDLEQIINIGLQAIPDKYRVPIVLKDIEGFSYKEMAEIMKCEIGTVKSRLARARSMLQKILEPMLQEE